MKARGYIGPGIHLRGTIDGSGELVVDGTLVGPVELAGVFTVGGRGAVTGDVQAKAVEVEGKLEGSVRAEDVAIRSGGALYGDVQALRVGLDDGGALHGTVDMDVELPEALLGGDA